MKCARLQCADDAYYLIVYGCLDQHIRELVLCFQHGEKWAMEQHQKMVACTQCNQSVDSYEFCWTDKLKKVRS
jgi:hypothetical protein